MTQGKIVEIIGAVVDVEFPRAEVPKIYNALKVEQTGLTLEVQQQMGDGVVRTIAMGSSDGLQRGLESNQYRRAHQGTCRRADTGAHHECTWRARR